MLQQMQLIGDNANDTPRYAAHNSFVTNPLQQTCGVISDVYPEEQCEFVRQTPECTDDMQFLDYMSFLYCVAPVPWLFAFKLIMVMLFCGLIFLVLGITADTFFCPALAAIAKWLGLSENLAGVTLLAFGNGAPDLFTAFADYEGDTELMYAELLGAAAFIIGCIAAIIIVLKPFAVVWRNVLRDAGFFILACIWIGLAFRDERFTYVEACGTILIYVLFLVVVFVEHFRGKRAERGGLQQQQQAYNTSDSLAQQLRTLEQRHQFYQRPPADNAETDGRSSLAAAGGGAGENEDLVAQALSALQPIDGGEWRQAGCLNRTASIIAAPIRLVLTLIVPCVDGTQPRNGWCKLLNCAQVVLLPLAILTMKQELTLVVGGVPIGAVVAAVSACLAVVVFFTSSIAEPPKYHMLFAVLGSFVGSMAVISTAANELVAALKTVGIISNLSDSFLGLSVLAWGNSVGDLISNIALARKGYQRMAFAACFGGPLFNVLLGTGVIFNLKIGADGSGSAHAREGPMGQNCNLFLMLILFYAVFGFALCQWQARRSIGVLMLCTYALFVLYCTLGQFEVMHPFATDHRNEGAYNG